MSVQLVVPLSSVLSPDLPTTSIRYWLVGLSRPRWTAAELRAALKTKQSVTFKHLRVLQRAGYATVERGRTPDARWTFHATPVT